MPLQSYRPCGKKGGNDHEVVFFFFLISLVKLFFFFFSLSLSPRLSLTFSKAYQKIVGA